MLVIFIRTVILFILLNIALRIMGKRHMGELDISEFVTTLMISEIATVPLENPSTPLLISLIPIVTLMTLEICSSVMTLKLPRLKSFLNPKPNFLIYKGELNQSELKRLRISINELMSALRQSNVSDISDVNYAIMEPNAKITIIAKKSASPPTAEDMGIDIEDNGIPHLLIDDGIVNEHNLKKLGKKRDWLDKELKRNGVAASDVFLMTADDVGSIYIIRKDTKRQNSTGFGILIVPQK